MAVSQQTVLWQKPLRANVEKELVSRPADADQDDREMPCSFYFGVARTVCGVARSRKLVFL
jgi:hypothetical protein